MAVSGLKSSVELETQPSARLFDRETNQSFALTETEAQLLNSWDGSASATRLSAAVFMHGLDIEPWQIEQFFERLERAGLLTTQRPNIPNFVASVPGIENPEDIVPMLRGDLEITRSETSKGTLQVKDPLTERMFTLYDFEVSIARMLDGKRSAAEVLTAANRLGIPVTLPTLKTFLQQLKAYRFIDQDVQGGDSTWAKRAQWTEEVRQLYQSALRMLRQGKFDEARSYAEAMEAAGPGNSDAAELKARIETEAKGSPELTVDFEKLHTPVTQAVPTDVSGGAADPFASFGFDQSQPVSAEALPPIPAAIDVPQEPLLENVEGEAPVPPAKNRKPLIIGAAIAAVVLGVLFRPVSVTRVVACELQLESLGVPRTTRAGRVAVQEITPGMKVDKGDVIARLASGDESLESLDAKTTQLKAKLAAIPAPTEGKKADAALAKVKKAQKEVDALEKKKKNKTIEKKLKAKQKALASAKSALDKFTHELARAEVDAELTAIATRRTGVAAELEKSVILAPASGVFIVVGTLPETLQPNDAWGQIAAATFAVVTKDELPAGIESATFHGPGLDADATLVDGKARVPIAPALVGAKGTLEVHAGRTAWILSRF